MLWCRSGVLAAVVAVLPLVLAGGTDEAGGGAMGSPIGLLSLSRYCVNTSFPWLLYRLWTAYTSLPSSVTD